MKKDPRPSDFQAFGELLLLKTKFAKGKTCSGSAQKQERDRIIRTSC